MHKNFRKNWNVLAWSVKIQFFQIKLRIKSLLLLYFLTRTREDVFQTCSGIIHAFPHNGGPSSLAHWVYTKYVVSKRNVNFQRALTKEGAFPNQKIAFLIWMTYMTISPGSFFLPSLVPPWIKSYIGHWSLWLSPSDGSNLLSTHLCTNG